MIPVPKMPWYKAINDKLEGHEWWINAGIVVVIVLSVLLLVRGDRLSRAAWFIYLISP